MAVGRRRCGTSGLASCLAALLLVATGTHTLRRELSAFLSGGAPRPPQLLRSCARAGLLQSRLSRQRRRGLGGAVAVAGQELKTAPRSVDLNLLEGVLRPEELEALLAEARRVAGSFSLGRDSVDGQPSAEFQLIDDGEWKPEAAAMQQVLERPLRELLGKIGELQGEGSQELWPVQSWIRRYAPGERREHPVHYDHKSMVTAVCSLTPPRLGSGLYVQRGPHVRSREWVDFGAAGTFAVHGWDLAHGVDVRGDEERFSLILFLKPIADIKSGSASWYRPLAEAGNALASYRIAMDLEAEHNIPEAKEFYRKAADQGHWVSMHRLGMLLQQTGDEASAVPLFEEAAKMGFANSQVSLADFLSGQRVAAPGSEAARWYEEAAAQNHPAGQHRAALVRQQMGDEAGAVELLQQAASRGWIDAQFLLGRRCQQRASAAGDAAAREEAYAWYNSAAQQGHPGAMNQLAVLAAEAGDLAASRNLLLEAAFQGHRAAMANLALYLERGIGGAADPAGAAEWRARAAQAAAGVQQR